MEIGRIEKRHQLTSLSVKLVFLKFSLGNEQWIERHIIGYFVDVPGFAKGELAKLNEKIPADQPQIDLQDWREYK